MRFSCTKSYYPLPGRPKKENVVNCPQLEPGNRTRGIAAQKSGFGNKVGEQAENEVRKDFTVSERVAIGEAVEKALGNRLGSNQYRQKVPVENIPQAEAGKKTRDIAAEKAGFGNGKTYQQAKKVVSEGAPELMDAVDSGRVSVSAAADVAELKPFKWVYFFVGTDTN